MISIRLAGPEEEDQILLEQGIGKKNSVIARHSDLPGGPAAGRRSIDRRASLEGALDEGEAAGPVVTEIGQG